MINVLWSIAFAVRIMPGISCLRATQMSIFLFSPVYAPTTGTIETPLCDEVIIAFEISSGFSVIIISILPLPVP